MNSPEFALYAAIVIAAASEIIALSPAKDNSIIQVVLRLLTNLYPKKR